MEGVMRGLMVLRYGDYGEGVTRSDGSPVEYVDLYDTADVGDGVPWRVTIDESLNGDRPSLGELVDVEVQGEVRSQIRRGQRKDGQGEWELATSIFKAKVLAFRSARAAKA